MTLASALAVTLPQWLNSDRVATALVVVIVAFAVFALISAWVSKAIITKVLSLALFAGLALFAWTQRTNLQDCANKVEDARSLKQTCQVAGFTVKLPADKLPHLPDSTSTTVPTAG